MKPNQVESQKQLILQVLLIQTQINELKQVHDTVSSQLADSKDALRKHKQSSLIPGCANIPNWQNQPTTLFCKNSAGFYQQISINKLVPYLQNRIQILTKIKKQTQTKTNTHLMQIGIWLKSKTLAANQLNQSTHKKVQQYIQALEDMQ